MPGSSSVTIQFDGAARAVSSPATVDFERDSTGWAPNQIMVGEEPWDANVAVIKDHGEPFTSVRVESTLMLNDPGVQVGQATLVDNLGNSYPLYHGSANYPPTGSIWDFEGPVNPVASTLTFTVQGYAALEDGDWTINVPVG